MMLPVEVHKMEFHQKLKLLREQRGLTQEELAEQLDITRQSVSKWELGINEPDLPTIRALCKILDCSYDALLSGLAPFQQKVSSDRERSGTWAEGRAKASPFKTLGLCCRDHLPQHLSY